MALSMLAASAAAAQDSVVLPSGVTVMTEEQIRAQIVGHRVSGYSSGTYWSEKFGADGTISGTWGSGTYKAQWTMSGPVMCFDYKDDKYDGCRTFSIAGDMLQSYDEEGKPRWTATLSE